MACPPLVERWVMLLLTTLLVHGSMNGCYIAKQSLVCIVLLIV